MDMKYSFLHPAIRYLRRYPKKSIGLVIKSSFFLFRYWIRKAMGKVDIVEVTAIISTRCTLNCRDCHNCIPEYRKRHIEADFPLKEVLLDFEKLTEVVDEIHCLVMIGGEPFMHKELTQIIDWVAANKKIKRLMIVTNGTIIPDTNVLEALKRADASVFISNYGNLAKNKEKVLCCLKDNGIECTMGNENMLWIRAGNVRSYERNESQLLQFYRLCPKKCNTYLHGKFQICDQAAHREDLGLSPDFREAIDVRKCDKNEFRKEWNRFQKMPYFKACNYCGNHTAGPKTTVPAAIQMEIKV